MTLASHRHLFDMPRDVCYLNASYMTPLLKSQVRAGHQALEAGSHPWAIGPEEFFDTTDAIRVEAATMMGAAPDDIAIVPSASYGISVAANNLPLRQGGAILVMAEEFPSNHYAWHAKAEREGGELVSVPVPADDDWTSAILDTIEREKGRLDIVSLANVHWSSGAVLDLKAISAATKACGAALVLDLSQSLGAMPFEVSDIGPDFMVSAGYKWLLAPYGISLMYVAPHRQQGSPLEESWITRKGSEDFAGLVNYQYDYGPGARRFDMGERANLVLAPVFLDGLKQINRWGVGTIHEAVRAVTEQLADIVAKYDLSPISRRYRTGHILGVHVGAKGPEILARLKANGVSASLRGDMLRLSPHLWVDGRDLETFEVAIMEAVSK